MKIITRSNTDGIQLVINPPENEITTGSEIDLNKWGKIIKYSLIALVAIASVAIIFEAALMGCLAGTVFLYALTLGKIGKDLTALHFLVGTVTGAALSIFCHYKAFKNL